MLQVQRNPLQNSTLLSRPQSSPVFHHGNLTAVRKRGANLSRYASQDRHMLAYVNVLKTRNASTAEFSPSGSRSPLLNSPAEKVLPPRRPTVSETIALIRHHRICASTAIPRVELEHADVDPRIAGNAYAGGRHRQEADHPQLSFASLGPRIALSKFLPRTDASGGDPGTSAGWRSKPSLLAVHSSLSDLQRGTIVHRKIF
jgi:hypothetical protein